jgi:uncharacterized protein (TIGR03083 family)
MALDYASIIEAESARIVAALEANRAGSIPWSDRWTVAHCAKHVGVTHHVVSRVIEDRPIADFGLIATLDAPDKSDPGLGSWVASGTAALAAQLRTTDPESECWSWYAEGRDARFWARRMAQETLVHRWDAEIGAGVVMAPMDPNVAADGVDEYLDIFTATSRALAHSPAGPSISWETTDANTGWLLRLPAEGQRVLAREHSRGDLALRGPAEGLLLFAWGRLDPADAGIEIDGDTTVLDEWKALIPPM